MLTLCEGAFLLLNDYTCSERKEKRGTGPRATSEAGEGDKRHAGSTLD